MTRSKRKRLRRVFGIAIAAAALTTSAAQARMMPAETPVDTTSAYVPADPGQFRLGDPPVQSQPYVDFVHDDAAKTASKTAATVTSVPVSTTSSGFDWTDAMIGAGVSLAILALAGVTAMIVRRPGRLGYR